MNPETHTCNKKVFDYNLLCETVGDGHDSPEDDLKFVEQSDWVHDTPVYTRERYTIFMHAGKHYKFYQCDLGNPEDAWKPAIHFMGVIDDMVECSEVEKKEVVSYKWVPVEP